MELFLALAALFGAGVTLAVHSSSHSWAQISDASALMGQGSIDYSRWRNPNSAPQFNLTEATAMRGEALARWETAYQAQRGAAELRNEAIVAFNAAGEAAHPWTHWEHWVPFYESIPIERVWDVDEGRYIWNFAERREFEPRPLVPVPTAELGADGRPIAYTFFDENGQPLRQARPEIADFRGQMLTPSLAIINSALNFLEWGVTPLFCSAFGFGEELNWGSDLSSSMNRCAAAYDSLSDATPKVTDWYSAASQEYTLDVQALQFVTAQAGVGALLTTLVTASESLDTQLQQCIEAQAVVVQIIQCTLAAFVVGLVIAEGIALRMETFGFGMSQGFQIKMLLLALTGASGMIMAMSLIADDVKDRVNSVANSYEDLATQIPSSVPSVSPYGGSLGAGSSTPWFGDVNLSPDGDESGSAKVHTSSEGGHARPPSLTDFVDSFLRNPATHTTPTPAADQPPQPPEASPTRSEPLTYVPAAAPRPGGLNPASAAAPQRSSSTWAESRENALNPTKAAPQPDIEEATAKGPTAAKRIPVGVAAPGPDQATSPTDQAPERRE